MKQTCFLFGHRETSATLQSLLEAAIEKHIVSYHVTEFIVGSYGGFDRLAAQVLRTAKQKYPHITLSMLLPYLVTNGAKQIPEGFDGFLYPSGLETVPQRYAIIRGNQAMIDQADYVIAFVWHPASNARKLLDYAQKRKAQSHLKITLLTNDIEKQMIDEIISPSTVSKPSKSHIRDRQRDEYIYNARKNEKRSFASIGRELNITGGRVASIYRKVDYEKNKTNADHHQPDYPHRFIIVDGVRISLENKNDISE